MKMAKKKRADTYRRGRAMREDASIGTTLKEIEYNFGLPSGSVQINLPEGKKARRDKTIKALLADWGEE